MSDVSKILCTKDDIIIFDITFLLSGKTFKESEEILFKTIKHLKKIHTFEITPENYKNLREQMLIDATD